MDSEPGETWWASESTPLSVVRWGLYSENSVVPNWLSSETRRVSGGVQQVKPEGPTSEEERGLGDPSVDRVSWCGEGELGHQHDVSQRENSPQINM